MRYQCLFTHSISCVNFIDHDTFNSVVLIKRHTRKHICFAVAIKLADIPISMSFFILRISLSFHTQFRCSGSATEHCACYPRMQFHQESYRETHCIHYIQIIQCRRVELFPCNVCNDVQSKLARQASYTSRYIFFHKCFNNMRKHTLFIHGYSIDKHI